MPTQRTLLLLLLVGLFWATSALAPALIVVAALILAGIIMAAVADIRLTPGPGDFELARHHNRKLSLRAYDPIEVVVENRAPRTVDIQVRDEPPPEFRVRHGQGGNWHDGNRLMTSSLKGQSQVRLTYNVRPTRRGDYSFGNLNLRWLTVLGLFMRQATYPAQSQVKVYPNLLEIRQYEQLARRGRVMQLGMRQARQSGEGGEFEQLRDYVPDDDYRRISWKATAKHGKPITIDFSPERNQNIIILIDVGRQMMTRPLGMARTTRLDLVINAALLFSYVAISRGDRVGLLIFGEEMHRYLTPRLGLGQFYYINLWC